ncbi:hypothetical protein SAMN05192583_1674 [Sphingomonas gellani]|uniref:Uncharacterized protein n=1 Tax=Sphingomonas gellani TaxID=1166340 RepID=A0A1H8CNT8_9SPHN|nr:hypothetical protein [Sphingomonas gellani]SEM96114.1 hypothetical protein SAMN05192583_1674 [Sphingomonas gellani]
MLTYFACFAAVIGYWAWQRSRYERRLIAPTAQAHALADAAAMALVIALLWVGGSAAARWGIVAAQGLPGATIGAILGVILSDPLRQAILRGSRQGRNVSTLRDASRPAGVDPRKDDLPPPRD